MSAPNDAVWFISRDGQHAGPFSADEFAEFEEAGHLRPADRVWQTGMDAWITYGDYEARRAAARFANPSTSLRANGEKCAICLLVRRWIGVLTNTAMNAFRGVSARFARKRDVPASAPASGVSPARSPLLGVPEPDVQRSAGAPVPGQPAHGRAMDAAIENLADPARRARPTPRLATEVRAATDIGLDLATFRAWVADGRLPPKLPDCGKYDMKAIHLALDRMSGIASREGGSNDWPDRFAGRKG